MAFTPDWVPRLVATLHRGKRRRVLCDDLRILPFFLKAPSALNPCNAENLLFEDMFPESLDVTSSSVFRRGNPHRFVSAVGSSGCSYIPN